jgi:pimeloyl-ACP methyl ester carboxylesterase
MSDPSSSSPEIFDISLPSGVRLEVRASGPVGAARMVFLHGFPEAAFIWDAMLDRFGRRHRCIAPNLRGFGRSSSPREVDAYRARHLVSDITALIEAGPRPVEALVAHDWGGALAWLLAAQRPALVRRLVIVNSPHPATFMRELQANPAQQAASAYMNFLCRPDAEALLADDDFARLWPFFTGMGTDHGWLTEPMKDRYREIWRMGLRGGCNYYRASPLRPPTAGDRTVMDLRLADETVTVRVPTTVLWGERDTALLPGLLDGLEAWVPDLRVRRVPDASHWIVHEQPDLVGDVIEEALTDGR